MFSAAATELTGYIKSYPENLDIKAFINELKENGLIETAEIEYGKIHKQKLDIIEKALDDMFEVLKPSGRLAIITFHSLEDRAVKEAFAQLAQGCTCPRDFPVCVCGNKPKIKIISKKPIVSSPEELKENPRAHSAKLRVAEKL